MTGGVWLRMALLRVLLLGLAFLLFLDGQMVTDSAARDCAEYGMMMCDMTGHRADNGTFQAPSGFNR